MHNCLFHPEGQVSENNTFLRFADSGGRMYGLFVRQHYPSCAMLHIVRGYIGWKYGFPSCHAANSFAIAVFTTLWFRRKWLAALLIGWALLECYTRLYLGVHYPSDIVFGMAIGSLIAYIVYNLSKRIYHEILLS